MTDTRLIMTAVIHASRFCQTGVRDGMDAASGAALRKTLGMLLRELDSIESEAYTMAQSFGINFDGLPPLPHLLSAAKSRVRLHFHNSDSCVSELLIQIGTKTMVDLIKVRNRTVDSADTGTELLLHRLLGCINASIRSLQAYL